MKLNLRKTMKIVSVGVIVAAAGTMLAACSSLATPTGMCGWVVGNGTSGHDAKIHEIVFPDENVNYDSSEEEVHYVPCGPRNYIITDGSVEGLGDRTTPVEAVTQNGTPVLVQLDALWQLNQDKAALTKFAELCNKYECYTTNAEAGESNFATDGWNGMLRENFSPAIDSAVKSAAAQIPDAIWEKQDKELMNQLATLVSQAFMDAIQVRTGYNVDLFCGSGNSGWSDPTAAGADGNTFTCSQVRFDVTAVKARDSQTQNNASASNQVELDTAANQARYDKSVPLYGDQTHFWIGVQDAASKCASGATCNFYLGNIPAGQ